MLISSSLQNGFFLFPWGGLVIVVAKCSKLPDGQVGSGVIPSLRPLSGSAVYK